MATNLIYGDTERLLAWAQERMGMPFKFDAHCIGIEREGELSAVVVYDNFGEVDCNIHVVSDGSGSWLTKNLLSAVFVYPFVQLGLNRVTALVPAKNTEALSFDLHLGFVREGYHPKALPDDDLISLGMLRENCRFLPKGAHQ